MPEGLVIEDEIVFRKERLENLAKAKAEYDAKMREGEAKAYKKHQKPRGKPPQPPQAGPQEKGQYNFTDPDSRMMKNSTADGNDQHYDAQIAVTQDSMMIVATSFSNYPNDKREAEATLDGLSEEVGHPQGVAMDNGYFSANNIYLN